MTHNNLLVLFDYSPVPCRCERELFGVYQEVRISPSNNEPKNDRGTNFFFIFLLCFMCSPAAKLDTVVAVILGP